MQIIRQMTPNVPILVFSFCSTSLTLRLLLRGNVPLQVARLSEETGRAKEDILLEVTVWQLPLNFHTNCCAIYRFTSRTKVRL